MIMTRMIAVVTCGLGLAACGSWAPSYPLMPSFEAFQSKPATASLTIESDPPGAEARTSQGMTCRTPCTVTVPAASEFTVSYALNGYTPQTATVRPTTVTTTTYSQEGPALGPVPAFEPNPLFVELKPVGPAPKPPPPKPKKKRPPATAAAPAAPPPPQMQSPFPPPPASVFAPAPGIGR